MRDSSTVIKIAGGGRLRGRLRPPSDKSLSHRALIALALAKGEGTISGLSSSDDVASTRRCLESCGVEMEEREEKLLIKGKGLMGLKEPGDVLDAGNSGTTLRTLPGVLAGQPGLFAVLSGDESLRKRPMRRIVDPLREMGARISGRQDSDLAPLAVEGTRLAGKDIAIPIASAQVKTAVLLAGLLAEGKTSVTEPSLSRDHTERMLSSLGAELASNGNRVEITGGSDYHAASLEILADFSSAAFFLVAALLLPGSEVVMDQVCANPTRTGLLEIMKEMGAEISLEEGGVSNNEEWAQILARSSGLKGVQAGGKIVPRMIDEFPILAVAATQAEGTTVIKDAEELRYKESDRIACLAAELKKMGAMIEETADGMTIQGPVALRGALVDSHGDHRLAMSLAVAALIAEGDTLISGSDAVAISYPGFFRDLESLRA